MAQKKAGVKGGALKKPPLTDAERHKRFKDMAREVEADDSPDALDKAIASIDLRHKSED